MLAIKVIVTLAAIAAVAFVWWPSAPVFTEMAAGASEVKCTPSRELLGLSRDQIRKKCGEPKSINHQMLDGGSVDKEQWSFQKPTFYVYLTNGKADSIQYAESGQNFSWKL